MYVWSITSIDCMRYINSAPLVNKSLHATQILITPRGQTIESFCGN